MTRPFGPPPLLKRRTAVQLLTAGLAGLATAARSAEADAAPPGRIGQLSVMGGAVQAWTDRASGWQDAELNLPVSAGMGLAAMGGGRFEVRVGSTAVHVAQAGRITVTELAEGRLSIDLAQGALLLRVRALSAGEYFGITCEGARLMILAPGFYRLNHGARERRLAVRVLEGQARLNLNQQDLPIGTNQRLVADTRTGTVLQQGPVEERSALDEFAENRDRRVDNSVALRYLPAEMTGAQALDGQGSWQAKPGQGPVWFPDRLPPDWAPYRFGRWRWMAPWGWTWLDIAPWGFAPFHYGRWLFQGGRWGWAPGVPAATAGTAKPVYAPALVGFYGSPDTAAWFPGGAAPAAVGWYPLAPEEVYWPAYTTQIDYVRALNAGSVSDAGAIRAFPPANTPGPAHRYARTAFAATAMPEAAFMAMLPAADHPLALPPSALAQAPLWARRAPPPAPPEGSPPPAPPR